MPHYISLFHALIVNAILAHRICLTGITTYYLKYLQVVLQARQIVTELMTDI